jgi:hypothetical protein
MGRGGNIKMNIREIIYANGRLIRIAQNPVSSIESSGYNIRILFTHLLCIHL